MHSTPVVTVDGPSGAGKGTLSSLLAKKTRLAFFRQWRNLSRISCCRLTPRPSV